MPSEQLGGRQQEPNRERQERQERQEREQPPYYQAARFDGERPAGQAYQQAQKAVYEDRESDLSAYRFQLERVYHVAVLGEPPSAETDEKLAQILAEGELTALPLDVLKALQERRTQMKQQGCWVEGHYRPGKKLDY